MATSYRRFSTEFKLRLVESYLAGDGRNKGLVTQAGTDHSLLHYWLNKYRAGELTLDVARGAPLSVPIVAARLRSTPARAGSTGTRCCRCSARWVYPRSRGEHHMSKLGGSFS